MTEIKISNTERPGWPCPACGGTGRNRDGKLDIGPSGMTSTPATKCGVCCGIGRVRVVPLTDAHGHLEKEPR